MCYSCKAAMCRKVMPRYQEHEFKLVCLCTRDSIMASDQSNAKSDGRQHLSKLDLWAGREAVQDGLYVDRESMCMMGYVARASYAMRVLSYPVAHIGRLHHLCFVQTTQICTLEASIYASQQLLFV